MIDPSDMAALERALDEHEVRETRLLGLETQGERVCANGLQGSDSYSTSRIGT